MDNSARQPETDFRGRLVRQVCTHVRCLRCDTAFGREDVIVLGEREHIWLVAVICAVCRFQGLVFARLQPGPRPDLLTELSPEEAEHFATQPAISLTDVRALRHALDALDGDISQLWQ